MARGTFFPNGVRGPEVVEEKTANFTLDATDSGKTFIIQTADLVASLPAASAALLGVTYRFIVTAAALSVGTGFSISPAAVDAIASSALTSVDDKDLINSGATDAEGDMAEVICDGGVTSEQGWYVTSLRGTWAKQP